MLRVRSLPSLFLLLMWRAVPLAGQAEKAFPDLDLSIRCARIAYTKPGSALRFDAEVVLTTRANPDPERGVQGWSLSIGPGAGVEIVSATVDGTAAAPIPEGYFDEGFEITELTSGPGNEGVISAVILSLFRRAMLPPEGDAVLLKLGAVAAPPDGGCRTARLEFRPGLVGSGRPVENKLTYRATTRQDNGDPRFDNDEDREEPCLLRLCPGPPRFRRGDCDGDGTVAISDPVFLLLHLFQSGPPSTCPAACDADGTGALSLTDGVVVLQHLFLGGPPPAPPYPDCGVLDPGAGLACEGQAACAP